MAVPEAGRVLAFQAGRTAARTGKPVTACPYRPATGDGMVLALWFVRGYRAFERAQLAANRRAQ